MDRLNTQEPKPLRNKIKCVSSSVTSLSQERGLAITRLLEQMPEVKISDGITFRIDEAGQCKVVANRRLNPGEELLSIPLKYCIGPKSSVINQNFKFCTLYQPDEAQGLKHTCTQSCELNFDTFLKNHLLSLNPNTLSANDAHLPAQDPCASHNHHNHIELNVEEKLSNEELSKISDSFFAILLLMIKYQMFAPEAASDQDTKLKLRAGSDGADPRGVHNAPSTSSKKSMLRTLWTIFVQNMPSDSASFPLQFTSLELEQLKGPLLLFFSSLLMFSCASVLLLL